MIELAAMSTQADSIEALTALLVSVCDPDKRTGLKKLFFFRRRVCQGNTCVSISIFPDLESDQANRLIFIRYRSEMCHFRGISVLFNTAKLFDIYFRSLKEIAFITPGK